MYDSTDFYKKTVYMKDYRAFPGERGPIATFEKEYPDTIAGPFYQYIVPENYKGRLPPSIPYEHHDEVIKRVVARRPHLKHYFIDEPLNLDMIAKKYKFDNRTMYQVELCNLDDLAGGYVSNVHLPDDYVVPPTIHRCSYRDTRLSPFPLESRRKIKAPPDNLKPCEITRRVMQIVTGDTEYQGVIGNTGSRIINEEYHGKYTRAKRPNNWDIQTAMVEFLPKKQDEGLCWKATHTSKRKNP